MSSRPVLALLHGWGMNARVFDALAARLADRAEVRALQLPGHGGRAALADNSLAAWADDLAAQLPDGAAVLGWSLGGQVALRAALDHPRKVARLILLATTPRFVAAADWPHAVTATELDAFGNALLADPQATLLRFLSLQTRSADGRKSLLQDLRRSLATLPPPQPAALAAGLAILRDSDLRGDVGALARPALVLHGALDTLAPAAAGRWLAAALPQARHHEFERAAHAPQLSHGDAVAAAIGAFLHD